MDERFGWSSIVRVGLVQAALGSIVVLATSTLNRVMVVELALPALLPGALVALHYAVQMTRPRMGWGSDLGGRRTPWIAGGMAVLAAGGVLAALATALMGTHRVAGAALAFAAFVLIGLGVAASGTSLLVLLAKRVDPRRRAAAATLVWIMMIAGFAVTAGVTGRLLDPYSPLRLVQVVSGVAAAALCVTLLAVRGLEPRAVRTGPNAASPMTPASGSRSDFGRALAQVWTEPQARRFTVFVFVSMLAFSAQDLILEPFAGSAFGFTPGESTALSGVQHGGVLVGMLLAAFAGSGVAGGRLGSLRAWSVCGCLASAVALAGLAAAGAIGPGWPLRANVFALGAANGAFSIAAIGSMMSLAASGRESREGVRMGLWGAAQAIAFAVGGLAGTAASDLAHALIGTSAHAYATVFALEAALFVVSATLAARVGATARDARPGSRRTGRAAPGGVRFDPDRLAERPVATFSQR